MTKEPIPQYARWLETRIHQQMRSRIGREMLSGELVHMLLPLRALQAELEKMKRKQRARELARAISTLSCLMLDLNPTLDRLRPR